ncbi:HlyD family type I secretion periplasmic adaptor subunit [Paraburkholderia mimosarum]|uniref:HlyD family type I secretion periplasmic adaptor subunit n=1 Tax=Paraburkholderia mimosarum TaxID=312026 RepID=UPI0003FF34D4|nr:HlyD family type I secretion periplasmic adaptor subunit [Paraburkholderia mimosarum]
MNIRYRIQAVCQLLGRYWRISRHAWQQPRHPGDGLFKSHEAEFLPAALALQARPVSPAGRWVARVLILLVVAIVVWATISRVDIVTTGQGKIAFNGETKTISATQIASVHALHVTEGQRVRAGQLLIELDNRETDSEHDKAESERQNAAVLVAVQRALIGALNSCHAPHLPRLEGVTAERQRDGAAYLGDAWSDYTARRAHLEADVQRYAGSLPVAREQEAEYAELAKTHDVSRDAWLQKTLTRIDIQGELAQARSELLEVTSNTRKTAEDKLVEAIEKEQSAAQDVLKMAAHHSLMELKSPVDGTVQQLAVHTVGAAVPAAQPLLQVVPLHDRIRFEASIEDRDVGFVREGQPAAVKIDAFDYTRYGTLSGRVSHVSRDAIADQKKGLWYAVSVELDKPEMNVDGRAVMVTPGMSGTVDIRTGSRRVIQYLLSPLIQHGNESLHER